MAFDNLVKNELSIWQGDHLGELNTMVDPKAPNEWQVQLLTDEHRGYILRPAQIAQIDVVHVLLKNEYALAEVVVTSRIAGIQAWQTLFYRNVNQQWLRTSPSLKLWGETLETKTDTLVFIYHQLDAPLVAKIAPQIEIAYVAWRDLLGFDAERDDKRVIKVIAWAPWLLPEVERQPEIVNVVSPHIAPRAIELSKSALLFQSMLKAIALSELQDFLSYSNVPPNNHWELIHEGLIDYFINQQAAETSQSYEQRQNIILSQTINFRRSLTLAELIEPVADEDILLQISRKAIAETLLEYVSDQYTPTQFHEFVQAILIKSDWDDVLGDVFQLTPGQFEEDWNVFLQKAYGNG